jgi:hypothetical protein
MTSPGEIPPEAQEKLKKAVDTALNKPQQAQGFLSAIPSIDVGGAKDTVLGVLNTVLSAIDQILQYKWLIPDKYEGPLESLANALKKVQGWLD